MNRKPYLPRNAPTYTTMLSPLSQPRKYGKPRLRLEKTEAGAEQGINPRGPEAAESYGQFKQACVIEVTDYTSEDVSTRRMTNQELENLMNEPTPQEQASTDSTDADEKKRPPVRWINIGGIDGGVLRALGLKYNLHALALEDILREQGHHQSKVDYYNEHLFIRVLCHILDPEDKQDDASPEDDSDNRSQAQTARSDSLLESGEQNKEKTTHLETSRSDHSDANGPRDTKRRFTSLGHILTPQREKQILKIKALARGDRVNVIHEPMYIFLMRNGTVITIFARATLDFTAPITERLLHPESILRTSSDASLLTESVLDLVVDRVLEIMDEYQYKINQAEENTLLRPGLSNMRNLHILSGDLVMHKRTLEPVKRMIRSIMRYDMQRCIALADAEAEAKGDTTPSGHMGQGRGADMPDSGTGQQGTGQQGTEHRGGRKVQGYFSYKAQIYLADVNDHMDFVLTSLDMFAGTTENLINYAFNVASYDTNEVMRRLTIITLICSPLTLLTGYFGMNFQQFSALSGSVSLFWKIAIPVTCVLVPLFMITDLKKMYRRIEREIEIRRSLKKYKNL
ncbi:magnesium transporter [Lyophyllum atratum]|nr:magnesium transporter [Lyophyllum atratum]